MQNRAESCHCGDSCWRPHLLLRLDQSAHEAGSQCLVQRYKIVERPRGIFMRRGLRCPVQNTGHCNKLNTVNTLLCASDVGTPNHIHFAKRHYLHSHMNVESAASDAYRAFHMDLNMTSCVYSNSSFALNTTATLFHPEGHQSFALDAVLSTRELARFHNSSCSALGHMLRARCTFTPKHGAWEKALGQRSLDSSSSATVRRCQGEE